MDYYLLLDYWASLVRAFKDSERELGIDPRDSELLAQRLLDWIRTTRIRQWNLFQQQRGEEYDRMIQTLIAAGFMPEAIQRFGEDETRWKATLEMGER